jgi:hypothetical protein
MLETEDKHEDLDGSRAHWRKRLLAVPDLGGKVPRSTAGVRFGRKHVLPRQSECDSFSEERQTIMWTEFKAHRHKVLLHKRPTRSGKHRGTVYCPTEQMLAEFFTKPLQGSIFKKFRAVIMGHEHIDSLKVTQPTTSQERVG